jgi:sulfur-oxidizing protein SoxY
MITRRAALAMPFVAAGLRDAWATPQEANDLVAAFTGGKEPLRGRVALAIPELIEDGHYVPLTVSVESPMTAEDRVESILIAAGANPWPGIAVFHFSPLSGEALVKTRVRLAATQMVQAVAKMSDGSFYIDRRTVEVVVGGCAG